MPRESKLPKQLQPMLATLTDKRPEDVVRETESPRKPRTKRGTS